MAEGARRSPAPPQQEGHKQRCMLGDAMFSLINAGSLEEIGAWLDQKAWTIAWHHPCYGRHSDTFQAL
eukprot:6726151-Prorocentrum_lima.AAC.1